MLRRPVSNTITMYYHLEVGNHYLRASQYRDLRIVKLPAILPTSQDRLRTAIKVPANICLLCRSSPAAQFLMGRLIYSRNCDVMPIQIL